MGGSKVQPNTVADIQEIIKKAYETGKSDENITVQQLIENLKADLMKILAS